MQPAIEQLDLTLYEPSATLWWHHPVILIIGIACTFMIVGGVWAVWRYWRRSQHIPLDVPKQTTVIIVQAERQLQGRVITAVQALATLTSALKRYTAWRCADETICSFTDQQWLRYVKNQPLFDQIIDDCIDLVGICEQIKFNYAQWALNDVARLLQNGVKIVLAVELAYQDTLKKASNKQT